MTTTEEALKALKVLDVIEEATKDLLQQVETLKQERDSARAEAEAYGALCEQHTRRIKELILGLKLVWYYYAHWNPESSLGQEWPLKENGKPKTVKEIIGELLQPKEES